MRWVALLMFLPAAAAEFDHSAWDRVLSRAVNDRGEVDYLSIARDRRDLDRYLDALRAASPDSLPALFPSRNHAMAYWINAYNAFVTAGVARRFPLASVRDAGRFFKLKEYNAGGRAVSLDDIEHGILRARFKDSRIHFAIVCASLGCPWLARDPYTGPDLDSQLDRATRAFLDDPRNLAIDPARNQITLSKIFEWYAGDFGGPAAVLDFIRRYRDIGRPRVRYRPYDWRLNAPGSRR
jgi:hypothetical protein